MRVYATTYKHGATLHAFHLVSNHILPSDPIIHNVQPCFLQKYKGHNVQIVSKEHNKTMS